MDRAFAIAATFAVGALVAFQPPANEQLARLVGTYGSALVSLLISLALVTTVLVFTGGFGELRGINAFRPEMALGGIAGAAIVVVTLITVRELGAGGVAAAAVTGQLILSVILDRLGIMGLEQIGLTPQRVAGVALLLAGTVLVTLR
jgi:transporter family-2 protein